MVAGVLVTVDQVTKALAEARLVPGERVDLLGSLLGLRLAYNTGAAFSLGTSITPVFTAFACIAVVAIVVAIIRGRNVWWAVALGLLLGGATGNLIDRLSREPGFARGGVVDFLQLPYWPIFNVADMGVVSGALLIVLLSFRGVAYRPEPVRA